MYVYNWVLLNCFVVPVCVTERVNTHIALNQTSKGETKDKVTEN